MDAPERSEEAKGEIVPFDVPTEKLGSRVTVIGMKKKPKEKSIEMADVLVVAGRGVKKKEDLSLLRELADALGGELACTRPLVEAGWLDAKHQIGLSGRTVRPKLIITCGVSGAIQFVAWIIPIPFSPSIPTRKPRFSRRRITQSLAISMKSFRSF